ncbi:hypothetical protein [Streptomyces sp. NPDC058457]|uniref:hypothetical protein n=1 Tax=Streptomyces sp. NPDC058457 TaxID=3346507 RepID=UPI0036658043
MPCTLFSSTHNRAPASSGRSSPAIVPDCAFSMNVEAAYQLFGGVHALAGLADDAPTRALRQTCIDVLCAYLRLPYTAEPDLPADDAEARHAYRALREVRHTVIRLIRDHLRLPSEHPHSWQGQDFGLTEVTFDGGDFSGAKFRDSRVTFDGAQFCGSRVTFADAQFFLGSSSWLIRTLTVACGWPVTRASWPTSVLR